MQGFIDLHLHSHFSDGTFSPTELVRQASEINLSAIALTDHDTIDGISELFEAKKDYPNIEVIAGVELTSSFSAREIHILGLFIDPLSEELNSFLNGVRKDRMNRNEAIKIKLSALGYPLSWDEISEGIEDCSSIGRPHFAKALMKKFNFSTMQDVFDKLLKYGRSAYVPRHSPNPSNVIDAIHSAGGVAIWAHPVYGENNERAWAKRVMKRLAPLGLDGIEGYYSLFNKETTAMLSALAEQYNLILSGGSDYHGTNNSKIQLGSGSGGLRVPVELLEKLKETAKKYQ